MILVHDSCRTRLYTRLYTSMYTRLYTRLYTSLYTRLVQVRLRLQQGRTGRLESPARGRTLTYVGALWRTLAHVGVRGRTGAYGGARGRTLAHVGVRGRTGAHGQACDGGLLARAAVE
jgi:hypothetical protein